MSIRHSLVLFIAKQILFIKKSLEAKEVLEQTTSEQTVAVDEIAGHAAEELALVANLLSDKNS